MSVKIIKGDLIKSLEKGELGCYAHQCNCFNRMGRGIAPLLAKTVFGLRQADNKTIEGDKNKLGTFEVTMGSMFGDEKIDHEWLCKRANEPVCDPGQIETTVCDGYKRRTYD